MWYHVSGLSSSQFYRHSGHGSRARIRTDHVKGELSVKLSGIVTSPTSWLPASWCQAADVPRGPRVDADN